MSDDKSSDDLDWLYSREPRQVPDEPTQVISGPPPPEPTRVMPAAQVPPPLRRQPGGGAQRPSVQQRPAAQQPVQQRPSTQKPSTPKPAAQPPSSARPSSTGRRRRKARPGRVVFTVLLLLLVWLLGVPLFHLTRAASVDDQPAGDRPADQPGTTLLLAGNDARAGVTGSRTDTMMLLYIPRTGKPALISLPRDSYLAIPGHGKNKLNAAYAFGGPPLLVQTVEQNTGLRIDGYLEISMEAFPSAVDAVGGIELCIKEPIQDQDSKANFPAGCQHLDGAQALSYARMRKADPRGDLGRVERQREVIAAIGKHALTPATLLPWRYWNLSAAMSELLTKGSDTSVVELGQAGAAFQAISTGNGIGTTVPISNPAATTSAGSSVLWDDALAKQMFADLARGDTSKLLTYQR